MLDSNIAQTRFYPLGDVLVAIRRGGEIPGLDSADLGFLGEIARWAADYLAAPHPDLGRVGDVCPWVSPSMREGLLLASVCHVFDAFPLTSMERVMRNTVEDFDSRTPRMGNKAVLKAMLVTFPSLECEWIEALYDDLFLEVAGRGLILDIAHPESETRGLHNPELLPFRCPLPLLGIRTMVPRDLPFVMGSESSLSSYLQRFGDAGLREITRFLKSSHVPLEDATYERLERALKGEIEG